MGVIRSEMERLDSAFRAAEQDFLNTEELRRRTMIEKLAVVIPELAADAEFLRSRGIQLLEPSSGTDLKDLPDTGEIESVMVADISERRFASIIIQYDVHEQKYELVEWRDELVGDPDVHPFEFPRHSFQEAQECLAWLASYLHKHLGSPRILAAGKA